MLKGRTMLGWLQLTHSKTRFIVAASGVVVAGDDLQAAAEDYDDACEGDYVWPVQTLNTETPVASMSLTQHKGGIDTE